MISFQELKKSPNKKIGKKALHLKVLQKNGVHIPKSFVITTDFQEKYYNKQSFNQALNRIVFLIKKEFKNKSVVIRSSATCEDSQFFSFAGQYSSFLNLKEDKDIKEAILMCYSSFKSKNAKIYSKLNNINLENEKIAILVQEFIPVEKAGVLFTANPVDGKDEFIIEFNNGLGDKIVSGEKKPTTLIIRKTQQAKELWVKKLCKQAISIKKIFNTNQDIEWGIINNEICIFQSRNITTIKDKNYFLEVLTGITGYKGIVSGELIVVNNEKDLRKIKQNNIVFLKKTKNTFSYLNLLKKSKGIIMTGGMLSHVSIILRELQIPFILIDKNIKIKNKNKITLCLVNKNGLICKKI
jgi:pyruvate,water dikinase